MPVELGTLKIVYVPIEHVSKYANNANMHDEENVAELAYSIHKYGFVNPIGLDEKGNLVYGHGRVMAAETLGMTEVPAIYLVGLTPLEADAYRLADNRLARSAKWDVKMLAEEVQRISDMDFDMKALGFSDAELDGLLAKLEVEAMPVPEIRFAEPVPEKDPGEPGDEGPAANSVKAFRVIGDVFQVGPHTIICGDVMEEDDIEELIVESTPMMIIMKPTGSIDSPQTITDAIANKYPNMRIKKNGKTYKTL